MSGLNAAVVAAGHGLGEAAPRRTLASAGRLRWAELAMLGSAAAVAESVMMVTLVRDPTTLAPVALAHIGLCLILGAHAAWRQAAGEDSRFTTLLALSTLALGPFGVGGALFTLALHAWFRRSASTFEEWYASLFPEEELGSARELYDTIVAGRDTAATPASVASFADILSLGTLEQKRAVIALLARHYKPRFAEALRMALSDGEPAIRVQAATAAAQIENRFQKDIMRLEGEIAKGAKEFDTFLALALAYDDYAFSGLLDPERAAANRDRALAHYRRCLELDPRHNTVRSAVGRIALRDGRFKEALEAIEPAINAGARDRRLHDWYLECLFRLGRFAEMRQIASHRLEGAEADASFPHEMREVLRLWAGRTA